MKPCRAGNASSLKFGHVAIDLGDFVEVNGIALGEFGEDCDLL